MGLEVEVAMRHQLAYAIHLVTSKFGLRGLSVTYAPLYWATSSPNTKTLLLDSNSSARASLRASRTATSFTPLGVAYRLRPKSVGNGAVDGMKDFVGATNGRGAESNREAGRKRRETTMTSERGTSDETVNQLD